MPPSPTLPQEATAVPVYLGWDGLSPPPCPLPAATSETRHVGWQVHSAPISQEDEPPAAGTWSFLMIDCPCSGHIHGTQPGLAAAPLPRYCAPRACLASGNPGSDSEM